MASEPPTARGAAVRALVRVAKDDAWLAPSLDAELTDLPDRRDRAFATELAYGTLRSVRSIDRAVAAHVPRGLAKVEPLALAALRVAAYQLLCLARVPPSAAVNQSVSIVRSARGVGLARFVNAVLRRVAEQAPAEPVRPTRLEVEPWIERALVDGVGEERAEALLAIPTAGPPTCLRVRPDRAQETRLAIARYAEGIEGAAVAAGVVAPDAILPSGIGDVRRLLALLDGGAVVQEEGAQAIGELVDVRAQERVLDACAGRGGKTWLLADRMREGSIDAVDVYPTKLDRLDRDVGARVPKGVTVRTLGIDLSVGTGALAGPYDRVLLDAPCTGLGTLVRRPELALRRQPEDVERLAAIELAIARRLVPLVREGGLFVYAVCSPTRAEGRDVIDRLLAEEPSLALDREPVARVRAEPDADGLWRFGPWRGGTDAYTAARLRKR